MSVQNNPTVIELSGNPRERGFAHGESVRALIQRGVGEYKEYLGNLTGVNPDEVIRRLGTETNFQAALERWMPDLLDELRGIGQGANLDFQTIYAYNLFDETTWFLKEAGLLKNLFGNCSALGAYDQGTIPNIIAKTNDLFPYYLGTAVLFHICYPESDLEVLSLSPAGVIGSDGLNNHGVGVVCNNVATMSFNRAGLPDEFIIRGILEQLTLREAIDYLQRIPHATGMNYIVGSLDGVVCLEASANKVVQYLPFPSAKLVYHTNHPLANDDYKDKSAVTVDDALTLSRFAFLERRLKNRKNPLTVEDAQQILSSREVPTSFEPGDGSLVTVMSMVMELTAQPVLHWTAGPPSINPFHTVRFGDFRL